MASCMRAKLERLPGNFLANPWLRLPSAKPFRCRLDRAPPATGLELQWRLTSGEERKRVALFASRPNHCLLDLLWRWRTHELEMDVVGVVSNHPDHERDVGGFGVPYHHVPVGRETKPHAEQQ